MSNGGSAYDDNSSRRAFALDSRTVWVEQQLVHQVLLPRDNLPLGPGEYTPQPYSRHVCTPSLGKFREPVDALRVTTSALGSRSPSRQQLPVKKNHELVGDSYAEFKTIHHFSEERQPYDPKNKFCETPGPLLPPDSALHSVSVLGPQQVHHRVHMDTPPPRDGRFPIKIAGPVYNVKYDSAQVRPTARLGTFSKNKRIHIPHSGDDQGDHSDEEDRTHSESAERHGLSSPPSPARQTRSRSPQGRGSTAEGSRPTLAESRCALVRLPKLKTKAPPVLIFQDSSYKSERLAKPLDLTPSLINKKAYTHLFDKYLAIPRKHKSSAYGSL